MKVKRNRERLCSFIGESAFFELDVTKRLAHIAPYYELNWDEKGQKFQEEELSFAPVLNLLIDELAKTSSYTDYHQFVDEELLASKFANEVIYLEKKRWKRTQTEELLKPEDIGSFLEQHKLGGGTLGNLKKSISSRIRAAQKAGIQNWDELDDGHRNMLVELITVVLYILSFEPLPSGQFVWESNGEFRERVQKETRG